MHFNTFKDKDLSELHLKIQSVPRSKHNISVILGNQLMLSREIIAGFSEKD